MIIVMVMVDSIEYL